MIARLLLLAALLLAVPVLHAREDAGLDANAELIAGDDCKQQPMLAKRYRRYCRPPLFHPITALAAYDLKVARSAASAALPTDRAEELSARIAKLEDASKPTDREPLLGPRPPSLLTVKTPAELVGEGSAYEILINDECPKDVLPLVIVNPKISISKELKQVSGKQFRLELGTEKLKDFRSVQLTVVSCQAFGLTRQDAESKELVYDQEIPIRSFSLTTRLNVWAKADVAEEFGDEFSRTFIVADAVVQNTRDKPILVYGSSVSAKVRLLMALPDVENKFGKWAVQNPASLWTVNYGEEGRLADALDFTESYRPLSFSDVLAIFSFKRESDPRQRGVSALKSLGTLLTAGAVFGVGQDYLQGVAFFTGAFVPEVEKQLLWDVLMHVKNLEQRSFKEVEEVPARSQLRKVVFFPRRPIEGIVPFAPMYIAEIRGDDLTLSGVLMKDTEALSGSAAPGTASTAP